MEALYNGIEASWNFKFDQASPIFKVFKEKGDLRHRLHKIELSIFKVLITGKKSLIDSCMTKILQFEEELAHAKANMQKNKTHKIIIDHTP